MQLGITIPLQKHLKQGVPPYGQQIDLFFCWELHIIRFCQKNTLIAVNANNCFTAVLWGMKASDWKRYPEIAKSGIEASMLAEGYSPEQIQKYFSLAGETEITKTHGRKPVGGLNRRIDCLLSLPFTAAPDNMFQKNHSQLVNQDICHAAGFTGYNTPAGFMQADMRRLYIL